MLTAILAIFWLSGSAAWANGTNALKSITDPLAIHEMCVDCKVTTTSFSGLNISLVSPVVLCIAASLCNVYFGF